MLERTAEKMSAAVVRLVVDVPALAGGGGAGEREPVVGDGEGGEEEAAEEDLFEERGEEGAEGGDQPDVGGGAEEVVHGDGLGDGDERGDGLDGRSRESEADGDEFEGVAAGGGGSSCDAVWRRGAARGAGRRTRRR